MLKRLLARMGLRRRSLDDVAAQQQRRAELERQRAQALVNVAEHEHRAQTTFPPMGS